MAISRNKPGVIIKKKGEDGKRRRNIKNKSCATANTAGPARFFTFMKNGQQRQQQLRYGSYVVLVVAPIVEANRQTNAPI